MIRKILFVNAFIMIALAVCCFLYPTGRTILDLRDPALQHAGIPKAAWRIYHNLTPRYAAWARKRINEGRAETLSTVDISGTEWPLFGSVFYLWAVENLQTAWDAGDHTPGIEPKSFAREAVIAASELVIDPRHATWVQKHWGKEYLHRENVFYRMLVIAALTSRERLLQDHAHLDMLRDQVETFTKELDASPSGLLDDYPGQCYPGDVMEAIACIRRADVVLGTDHSVFAARALRGFTGSRATSNRLPPYSADGITGRPFTPARGCGISYMCLTSPELWPAQAHQWFEIYDHLYWDESLTAVGFREFGKDGPKINWTADVDAGPVIGGLGISACAFGVGATRINGRFDRAYPLSGEMLTTMWELPNGTLAVPRMLSNLSDAPLLGEAGILWQLTVQPAKGFPLKSGSALPKFVYILLAASLLTGLFLALGAFSKLQTAREKPDYLIPARQFQICAWCFAMAGLVLVTWRGNLWWAMLLLLTAILLPVTKKRPPENVEKSEWEKSVGKSIPSDKFPSV